MGVFTFTYSDPGPNTILTNVIYVSGDGICTLESTVVTIGTSAFQHVTTTLTGVVLSSATGLTTIGDGAFKNCSLLTSVTIPSTVTSIGSNTFNGCSSLTSVTIPSSVTSIGNYTFNFCSSLTSVTIPSSVTSIGEYAFANCSSLSSATFSATLSFIVHGMFSSCTSLTSITIPNSVISINNEAFYNCASLTNITIPSLVTNISNLTFKYCSSLTSITIPSNVTNIGDDAFLNCTLLSSVQIDNQEGIANLGTTVFNPYNEDDKSVLFYLTEDYNELTDNGKAIASYFSATPSTETTTILYNSAPACFNEDTKILCLNKDGEEEYIPIQNLRKGDLVKSYLHGYRKIDLIGKGKIFNDPSKFTSCMYIFEKTNHNDLIEDLIVTGGHSILVDQLTDQEQLNQSTVWDRNYKIDNKVLLLAAFSSLFKPITT
jgi:hypothetical protein